MDMKKTLLIFAWIFCLLNVENAFSQALTVRGKIAEGNEPLPWVSVKVKGSTTGTTTNANGEFSLTAPGNAVLVITSIGFKTKEVPVNQRNQINVILEEDLKALDEVVVVGYGTVKKSDVTGSVGSVSGEDLTAFPVSNALLGLQGKTTGVRVIQNSGAPGAKISVRIRGGNSLLGNNEPLYVVDGIALSGGPNAIDPNDIESMEVLKDASATAIYGSRGANGVVLITTKRGKKGKTQVTFDSYYTIQKATKKIDLMNASEFAQLANQRAANDGGPAYFTQDQINSFSSGTDWQDVVFRPAPMQNYSINASGGSENTQYSISGSFLGQDGIIQGSNINRESLRANINQKISNKISLSYNAILTNTDRADVNSDNGEKGSTVTSGVLTAPPTIGPFDENGEYSNVQAYVFSPRSNN